MDIRMISKHQNVAVNVIFLSYTNVRNKSPKDMNF